ncbi:hypothetical protein JST99_01730 [Candidatus Dependentiae bacterium]|nr:hypothetical protein [Candidatus Dependentiae bacterium]MCC7414703.1 hypothetical protein [Campylobacterota bacterium]
MKPSLRLSAGAFSLLFCASQSLVGTTQTTATAADTMSSVEFLTGVKSDHTAPTPNTESSAQQMLLTLLTLLTAADAGDPVQQLNANRPQIMLDNPRQASLVANLPKELAKKNHLPKNRHVPRLTSRHKCPRR